MLLQGDLSASNNSLPVTARSTKKGGARRSKGPLSIFHIPTL
jgi:hypothetical protein